MDKHRRFSMLFYGAAALVAAVLMVLTTYAAVLLVALPFAVAAAADRFINRDAEPDERLRSFVIYLVGAAGGLLLLLMFGRQLGSWTFVTPLVGFGVLALVDYLMPPEKYLPRDPHRYGESPAVTVR